jgi:hypothetical protein
LLDGRIGLRRNQILNGFGLGQVYFSVRNSAQRELSGGCEYGAQLERRVNDAADYCRRSVTTDLHDVFACE